MTVIGSAFIELLPLPGFAAAAAAEAKKGAQDAEKAVNEGVGGFSKISTVATSALGVAAVAVASYSVHAAESFEKASINMQANAGITKAAADSLGNTFLNTAGKTVRSAQDLMTAYAPVAGLFTAADGAALSNSQALNLMMTSSKLAGAAGASLGDTTKTLSQVLIANGISTKDAAGAADILYNTSKSTGISVGDLGTAVDKLHAKMGDLAPNLADTSTLIVQLAQGGQVGGRAVMALTSAMNTLTKDNSKASAELDTLGVSIRDSSGHFVGMRTVIADLNPIFEKMAPDQRDLAAATLFGTAQAKSMLDIILKGPAAFDRASEAVSKHGTVAARSAEMSKTLGAQEQTLIAAGEDLAVKIGQKLVPVLADMMGWLSKGIDLVEHNRLVQIALAAAVAAVVVPALVSMAAALTASVGAHVASSAASVAHAAVVVASWFGIGTAATAGAAIEMEASAAILAANVAEEASIAAVTAAEAAATAEMVSLWAEQVAAMTGTAEAVLALEAAQETAATTAAAAVAASTQAIVGSYGEEVAAAQAAEGASVVAAGGLASLAGPIGLIAVAVGGLVASLTSTSHLWDDVTKKEKDYVQGVVSSIPAGRDQLSYLGDLIHSLKMQDDAFLALKTSTNAQRDADKDVTDRLSALSIVYDNLKKKTDAQKAGQDDLTQATKGTTDALGPAANAAADAAAKAADLKTQTDEAAKAEKAAKQATNDLKSALDALVGVHVSMAQANATFAQDVLDDTTKLAGLKAGVDLHTGAVKWNTQAGIDLSNQLSKNVSDIIAVGKATLDSTGDADLATAAVNDNVKAFDDQLKKLGLTPAAIEAVNKQYGLVPADIATALHASVSLDTAAAVTAIQNLNSIGGVLFSTAGKTIVGPHAVAASGTFTQGLTLAGEGDPRYGEWVIPSDPKYRQNAIALGRHMMANLPGLEAGGIVNFGGFAGAYSNADLTAASSTQNIVDAQGASAVANILGEANTLLAAFRAQAAVGNGLGGDGYGALTSWLGVPYLWGGGHNVSDAIARRVGLDCSGLVNRIYGETGNTGTQVKIGSTIPSLAAALAGDLLFYGSRAAGEPHHVGIYVGGNQQIDAPHTGANVRYDPIYSDLEIIKRWPNSPGSLAALVGSGGGPLSVGNIINTTDFAVALEQALGDTVTDRNNATIARWARAEGGNWHNNALFNPLNTTKTMPGSHSVNSIGVQAYLSWAEGIAATVATINNGRYPNVVSDLRRGVGLGPDADPDLITWGTGPIFDNGGWMMPGTGGFNTGTGPELVLTPQQSRDYVAGGTSFVFPEGAVQVSVTFAGPPDAAAVAAFKSQAVGPIADALESVLDRVQAAKPGGFG